jgi:hypothetical protein
MIYGSATVEYQEDGFLKITSIEECDAVALSKELFIMMINSINEGISYKKLYESNYVQTHTYLD